jgi:hypothetical protein
MASFRFIGEGDGIWCGHSFTEGSIISFDPETEKELIAAASTNHTFEAVENVIDGIAPAKETKEAVMADLEALGADFNKNLGIVKLQQLRDSLLLEQGE